MSWFLASRKAGKKVIDHWPNFRNYSGKLPRINDGALLFLIHMISKFQPYEAGNRSRPGTRVAIVFNGSPLKRRAGRWRDLSFGMAEGWYS